MDPALAVLLEALHRRAGTRALAFPLPPPQGLRPRQQDLAWPSHGRFLPYPGRAIFSSFTALRAGNVGGSSGPTVAAFAHRQRRCDDMLAAFRKLLSGECRTRYDHPWALACEREISNTKQL